jgi:hypothetical protein
MLAVGWHIRRLEVMDVPSITSATGQIKNCWVAKQQFSFWLAAWLGWHIRRLEVMDVPSIASATGQIKNCWVAKQQFSFWLAAWLGWLHPAAGGDGCASQRERDRSN